MMLRRGVAWAMAVLLFPWTAIPAAAAEPPPNDDFADAAAITDSTSFEVDLAAASPEDIDAEAECERPLASSVWFSYTTASDEQYLTVEVTSDAGDAVVGVVAGDPSKALNSIGCDAAAAGESALAYPRIRPEVRYWVVVGSSGDDGIAAVKIRTGRMRSYEGFVRSEGGFAVHSGAAVLRVYTNCNTQSQMRVVGKLTQDLPFAATADFDELVPCDGPSEAALTIPADSGRFVAGNATFEGGVLACSDDACFGFGQEATVLLREPSL